MKRIGKQIISICLVFLLFAEQVAGAVTYQANRSTFLDATKADVNQSHHNTMTIKAADKDNYRREGIIGFDLPSGDYTDINKATLRLFLTKAEKFKMPYTITQAAIEVFGFDDDWDEKTVTWNTKPDFSRETKAGESYLPEKINEWIEIDVSQYFKQTIRRTNHLSFHITGDMLTQGFIQVGGEKHKNKPELLLEKSSMSTPPRQGNSMAGKTLEADQSTYVYGHSKNGADRNFSNHATMIVKYANNKEYRRDGLIGFTLPTGDYSEVKKAILKVFVTKANVNPPKKPEDAEIVFYGFTGDWDGATVTWNDQPTYQNEKNLGMEKVIENQWTEIDITDYLKKYSGEKNISFRIEGDRKSEAYLNIAGAKHGNKPQIILEKDPNSQTPPSSGDTQADVDVDNVNRMVSMDENDTMLKSLYIDKNAADKNRSKTDTLLVGKEYSAYVYTDSVKVPAPGSAFLRFYVREDYKAQPIPVEIWGIKNPAEVGENTSFKQQPETESSPIYELNITNKGWYSVDVTEYVNKHDTYAFYLKAKDSTLPVVKIASYNSETTPVLYTAAVGDEFDQLRQQFSIKKGNYDINDPQIKALIQRIDNRADSYLAERNTDPNPSCVFWKYPLSKDKQGKSVPVKKAADNMRNSYVWLNNLLRAYHTRGSKYENDATLYQIIKEGMELLYQVHYNPFTPENGNWWQWEIGVPKVLGEMLVTMYDDLTPEQRMNYANAIFRFQPNPELSYYNRNSADPKEALPPQKSVGANRVDTCIGGLLLGISAKNPELIRHSVEALHDVYQYVSTGDGFYHDGSFIQHKNIAYTTAYGMVLISGLTDIDNKMKQSRWKITDPDYQNVYAWLENSFIPMVFDGQAFPIVAGRSLSRQLQGREAGSSFADGYKIARMLYVAAQGAPVEKRDKWLSLARRFMEKNDFYDVKANASNVGMLTEYEKLQTVDMAEPYIGSHVFANMDRVVHHRGNYAIALAMYSSRIQNFEMMNGENLKGWNQGNGTLYLLNSDSGQYDDAFWPTVDPYRLAGTTVDNVARLAEDHKEEFTMKSDFVGGASLDNRYSVAAMALDKPNRKNITHYQTTLTGKKSWFFFDDEVIALGSGIHSTDNREVETIVENRMIRRDAGNQVLINGTSAFQNLSPISETHKDVLWAYLEGNKGMNTGIGYYFPDGVSLTGIKQSRTGSWKEINTKGSADVITRNYVTLWLEHGKNPINGQYSYALLPDKSADEVKAYAQTPQYEVRKNTAEVQAVYEKELGILAANVFDRSAGDLGDVKVNEACSLMLQQKDGKISLAVADPTMKLSAPIRLELTFDKEITVTDSSKHIKVLNRKPLLLEISLNGSKGEAATLHGTYEQGQPKPEEPKPQPEQPSPKAPNSLSPYVPTVPESSVNKEVVIENEKTPETIVLDENKSFSDVADSWAKEEITYLAKQGIVKGYPDNRFQPEEAVSRAETAQLLVNLLLLLDPQEKLLPVESGKPWYHRAVEKVNEKGMMVGNEHGDFLPEKRISRQEMFTVLGRFGKWQMPITEAESVLAAFVDNNEIAEYAKPYIAEMVRMGLIKGENGKLQPKQAITRAELAVMFYRVLKVLK